MPLPSNAKLSEVIAKLQSLTGVNQIPDFKEALQARGITLTGNETMVDLIQIVKNSNFNNTADATAAAANILQGKTAYVQGQKITGTMVNRSSTSFTPGPADLIIGEGYYNGSSKVQKVTVPVDKLVEGNTVAQQAGTLKDYSQAKLAQLNPGYPYVEAKSVKVDGAGRVVFEPPTGYYTTGLNADGFGSIIKQDPNFIPANIVSGKSIFGVAGTAPTGGTYNVQDQKVYYRVSTGGTAMSPVISGIKKGGMAIVAADTPNFFMLSVAALSGYGMTTGDFASTALAIIDDVTGNTLVTLWADSYSYSSPGSNYYYMDVVEIDHVNDRVRWRPTNAGFNAWKGFSTATNNSVSLVVLHNVISNSQAGVNGGLYSSCYLTTTGVRS